METSILKTIRRMIGPSVSYDIFDTDLIVHINSAFFVLYQLGVGPSECFRISGEIETWDDFIQGASDLDAIISYVYMKVRYIFDPPSTGYLVNAYKESMKELEWRLNVLVDPNPWPITP